MKIRYLLAVFPFLLAAAEHPAGVSAEEALKRLAAGNQRYVEHKEQHPDLDLEHRRQLTQGQHPFAIVLGCADSRVPPELVFDQGLGDLFVIRDAGNVSDDVVLGSIEYAAEHLGVRLVMVLAHEQCGAVTAAVNGVREAHVTSIMKAIQPALESSAKEPGDKVSNCVRANARLVARQIREAEPLLKELVHAGKLKVVAANYEISSGKVTLLE